MAEKQNTFKQVASSLMLGAEGMLTSKTVAGEPIVVGDTILIPLSDVSIGCGLSSGNGASKDSGSGGVFAKMTPTAVLVVHGENTKVVSIKDQNTVSRVIDMVPDVIDKFAAMIKDRNMMDDDDAKGLAFPEEEYEEEAPEEDEFPEE